MKIVVSISLVLFITCENYGQNDKKNLIGTHFSFGDGVYTTDMDGGSGYDTKYYYSIGLDYSKTLSNTWDFCTGLEYTYSPMMKTPAYMGKPVGMPHEEHISLTTIPIQMKLHIWKFIYLDGGLFFNILGRTSEDWSVQSRDGEYRSTHNLGMFFGCGLGIGLECELFGSGVILSLNSYARWNGIGSIGSFYFTQLTGYQFFQSGVSLGIGYKF